jgi:hypothetical protein
MEEEKQKHWDIGMENQQQEPTLEGASFLGMLRPYPQILDYDGKSSRYML